MKDPSPKIQKLLVVALKPEWSFLKQHLHFNQDPDLKDLYDIAEHPGAALLQVGVEVDAARDNFLRFLEREGCQSVLHFGTSGALTPALKCGDLVSVSSVCFEGETIVLENPSTQGGAGQVVGKLFTSRTILKNKVEKEAAHQQTGAMAVDMESFPIAKICRERGIKYSSIRGIFDEVDDDFETLIFGFHMSGDLDVKRTAVNVLKDPRAILKIPALKKKLGLVNRAMEKVVQAYLES